MIDDQDKMLRMIEKELQILIKSESLKPGDRLPNLDQLVSILNVSRTKLRNALLSLQDEGFLDISQGKGIRVGRSEPEPEIEMETSLTSLRMRHYQECRIAVESETAYLAARHATDQDKQDLLDNIQILKDQHLKKLEPLVDVDYRFHYLVARIAGNPILLELLRFVNKELAPGRQITLSFPKGLEKTIRGHYQIYQAIEQGDSEEAQRQMRSHLQEVLDPQTSLSILRYETDQNDFEYKLDQLLDILNK